MTVSSESRTLAGKDEIDVARMVTYNDQFLSIVWGQFMSLWHGTSGLDEHYLKDLLRMSTLDPLFLELWAITREKYPEDFCRFIDELVEDRG